MRLSRCPPTDPAKRRAWCRAAKRAQNDGLGVFVPGRRGKPTRWAAGGIDPLTGEHVSYQGAPAPQKEEDPMLEFARTPIGRTLLEHTLPRLVAVLDRLGQVLERPVTERRLVRVHTTGAQAGEVEPPEGIGWRVARMVPDGYAGAVVLWERSAS